jgi:hypothetical protein
LKATQLVADVAAGRRRHDGPIPPGQAGQPAQAVRADPALAAAGVGLRLPPTDYARNDLTLVSILTDGEKITGIVDWDEFGLGSRALDLIVLALDCQQRGAHAAADRLLARAASVVGNVGLRCVVSLRPGRARRGHPRGPAGHHCRL